MRIRLFSEVTLFKYNVSTILSPIVVYVDPDAMFVLEDNFLTVSQASLQAFLLK